MLKEYFTFSKNQSRGIVILICSIVICMLLHFSIPYFFIGKQEAPNEELQQLMAQISMIDATNNNQYRYTDTGLKRAILTPFRFDPNTLDSAGFRQLGLSAKLVHTLLNYRNKGGKFYNAGSFKRIYGLKSDEYQQLESYIVIEKTGTQQFANRNEKTQIVIELNTADTAQLVQLRGIGAKLSINIIRYREQLGGYAQVEQLKEVYGISDETYGNIRPFVKVNTGLLQKINLNEVLYRDLNKHPYFKGEIAKALVEFRKKNNYHIDNLGQLKEIELINEEIFRKIAPYLTLN